MQIFREYASRAMAFALLVTWFHVFVNVTAVDTVKVKPNIFASGT
jgi:hypothetical protein